jgi:hypothetical protein
LCVAIGTSPRAHGTTNRARLRIEAVGPPPRPADTAPAHPADDAMDVQLKKLESERDRLAAEHKMLSDSISTKEACDE